MDDVRARKAAKNEALTRSLNEGLARGEEKWPSEEPTFICECCDLSCVEEVSLSLDDYRHIHKDPRRFIVKPGHEVLEIEKVIDDRGAFKVVEKIGPGRDVVA